MDGSAAAVMDIPLVESKASGKPTEGLQDRRCSDGNDGVGGGGMEGRGNTLGGEDGERRRREKKRKKVAKSNRLAKNGRLVMTKNGL